MSTTLSNAFRENGIHCLYYFCHIYPMLLILSSKLYSRNGSKKFAADLKLPSLPDYADHADRNVLARRQYKKLNGRSLLDYVNLYMGVHTPMQYVIYKRDRERQGQNICFLEVNVSVVDQEGVFYTNGNAASDDAEFYNDDRGIQNLDLNLILSKRPCYSPEWKFLKAAEVLVPDHVSPDYFGRVVCMNNDIAKLLRINEFNLHRVPVEVECSYFYYR